VPTLYTTLLCGGVLIAAALICMVFYLLRRARRSADERVPRNASDWEHCGRHVLWDVRGRTSKLVVRDGVLYIDRRRALVRGFRSVLAIVGIVAVGRSAGAVSELLQGDGKKRIADNSDDHIGVGDYHIDIPHSDAQYSHTDVSMPFGHTDSPAGHMDIPHQDFVNPHTDNSVDPDGWI